jgi:hypothetical protein
MHDGGHDHDHKSGVDNIEEALAYLKYTLHHNGHHADELHDLAHTLEHLGRADVAEELHNCMEDMRCANDHLENSIKILESRQ